jgi:propionyl-CoA carboxylase alpha chain
VIARLLVANRGEIALRIFRTCRRLGIETVAIYPADDAHSPHVAAADLAVALDAVQPGAAYLDAAAIATAAELSGADSVHPGYGFLAESPILAEAVAAVGKTFVGPSVATLRAAADKVEARRTVADAGVPILPGASVAAGGGDLVAAAAELGRPLLIKARAGGGGRGMRRVGTGDDLAALAAAAQREAEAAFGDGRIYLERLVAPARHLEVQILADTYGRVLHLGERECTVQRRHQKLVEETPSVSVDADTRDRLHAAAVAAATAVGYHGAGTVEFLLDSADRFYFIEFNTRLQVEHTVTEEVTGIDLVEQQLLVAAGGRLPAQDELPARHGHAIQARIYAEDPRADFEPRPGRIYRIDYPGGDGIRVDSGVEAGTVIGPAYDTLLMKVIASGPDRTVARRRLIRALAGLAVHGPDTTAPLLRAVVGHASFAAGEVATDFLDTVPLDELLPALDARVEGRYAVAAALAGVAAGATRRPVFGGLPPGWRNVPTQPQHRVMLRGGHRLSIDYTVAGPRFTATVAGLGYAGGWTVTRDGAGVVLEIDGLRLRYTVTAAGDLIFLSGPEGPVTLQRAPRFRMTEPEAVVGSLAAPLPGLVVATPAPVGSHVEAGDVLVVIEAMKLEHRVVASAAGTVRSLHVSPGDQVEAGTVVAAIDPVAASPSDE